MESTVIFTVWGMLAASISSLFVIVILAINSGKSIRNVDKALRVYNSLNEKYLHLWDRVREQEDEIGHLKVDLEDAERERIFNAWAFTLLLFALDHKYNCHRHPCKHTEEDNDETSRKTTAFRVT